MPVEEKIIQECPACGATWDVLSECLKSLPIRDWQHGHEIYIESEDHATARFIIGNCPSCKAKFGEVK